MKLKAQFSLALAVALALGCGAAFAQDTSKPAKPMTPQQQRMVDCNKQATGKTGDERKTFMSSCLKGETAAPRDDGQADAAGKDEDLQRRSGEGKADRRRAQDVYEHVPQGRRCGCGPAH